MKTRTQNRGARNSGRFFLMAAVAIASAAQLSAQTPLNFGVLAGSPPSAGSEDGSGGGGLRFSQPAGAAVDGSGNIFIADAANHVIRKITPAGAVTSFAGLAGSPGYADGIGGAARFKAPLGIEIDSIGNLFVADTGNHTIRRIAPSGAVTTLAGFPGMAGITNGTGSAARFNLPCGLTLDGSGNVYVADSGNNTIRMVTPAGVVSTLAGQAGVGGSQDGTGTGATFDSPIDLAWDAPSGTLYVTDYNNALIRKIAPGGVVTTFAGNTGDWCKNADGGLNVGDLCGAWNIVRDSSGNFYVTDEATHNIRKITADGVISTLAGPNQALCLPNPSGWICPTGNTNAVGTAARFNAPEGIAFDAIDNSLWVTDYQSNDLRKIALTGATVTRLTGTPSSVGAADGTGTDAQFTNPKGLTRVGSDFYVGDAGSRTLRKITSAGVVTTIAGIPYARGFLDGPGATAKFRSPGGLTSNGSGTLLYVADGSNNRVRTVDLVGATHTVGTLAGSSPGGNCDGSAGIGQLGAPQSVAYYGGNVYVADSGNNNIRRIDGAGNLTTLAGWVASSCPGTAASPGTADGTGAAASFNSPAGIAADGSGNLYVADSNNYTIRKITPAGVVTRVAGFPGLPGSADGMGDAARFGKPTGLSFDVSGNLLIADQGNNTLRQLNPVTYVVTTIAGTAGRFGSGPGTGRFARFGPPGQVITDASGNYVVTDGWNHAIRISAPTGLADLATIDAPYGPVGAVRQLSTSPNNATTWQWKLLRQPTGSGAALSSTSSRNPTFTPDLADYYTYQVTATGAGGNSTTEVALRSALSPVIVEDAGHRPSFAKSGEIVLLRVKDLRTPVQLFFSNGTNPTVAAAILGVDTDRGMVLARVPATAQTGYLRLTSAGTDALPYYYRIGAGTLATGPDQVSGTLTRQSDGTPIASAMVFLLVSSCDNTVVRDAALTDGLGHYLLHGDPGAAQVFVFAPVVAGTVSGSSSVTLSGTPATASFLLEAGTTVTGSVVDGASGRPLAGATLEFNSSSSTDFGFSDANGGFSVHLRPGPVNDVRLEIHPPYKTAGTYFQSNFTIGASSPQSLGTIALAQGVSISGTMTRALDGTPISGAEVGVYPLTGGGGDLDRRWVAGDGSYLLTVPPNRAYRIWVYSGTAPFVGTNGVDVTVALQPVVQNFALADAGTITGIVTDSGTGLPIYGLEVQARLASDFSYLGSTRTCQDGSYSLVVPPGGANSLVVSTRNSGCTTGCNPPPPPPYANLTYKSGGNTWFYCEGTPLTVASAGATISGINLSTLRAATVTGSFFNASSCTGTNTSVNSNQVTIDDGTTHACGLGEPNYNSPPSPGTYLITNLPPSGVFAGGLRSCVSGGGTYSPQCSYKKLPPAYTPIAVAAAGTVAANFCLGNQPTTALDNSLRLSKSAGNVNFTWNASTDPYHDHYRVYQATTARPASPPGFFPGDPFLPSNFSEVSGTSFSLAAGSPFQFFLLVDTGATGTIGPSGSYGN